MGFSKEEVIQKYAQHPTDRGSAQVQIALLTTRINELTDGVGASSDKVLNERNPIGPKRQHLMDE